MFDLFGVPAGRIVTTSISNIIIGLRTKHSPLEDNTVYEVIYNEYTGVITLKKLGKSQVDWNTSHHDLCTTLLKEGNKVILTDTELIRLKEEGSKK